MAEDKLQTCNWLEGQVREVARAYLVPALESRRNRMQGRLYYLLTNLRTYPDFQRKGAAIALVQWGVEPVSSAFRLTLRRQMLVMGCMPMGFEKVDVVKTVIDEDL